MNWTTACLDWEQRLLRNESLLPFDPMFPEAADAALSVFKSLRLVDVAGRPTIGEVCRPWVFDIAKAVFGTCDPDTGRRLVRHFFLLVSKKNSKSSTAAAIMLTALIRNWRDSAEFIILAPTIEVANNSFIPARDMVYADPELSVLFHVKENFRLIQHRLTKATLKVVTADSTVVGGKKAVGVLIDELWQFGSKADADNMLREATGGLASRPEGFVIYLSTQSDKPPAGVFKTKLQEFRAIRDGEITDSRSLPLIYEYPKQIIDSGAYLDPTNFYITNPNLGASVDAEFLIDQLAKAQRAGDAELCSFAAKHLNIEIGQSLNDANWRGIAEWSQAADDSMSLEDIIERSEVMVAGIDGGGLDDLLALGLLGRERGTDRWLYWMHCWVHRKSLQKHLQESPRFNDFAKDGDLTIVDDIAIACSDLANRVAVVDRSRKLATKEAVGVDSAGIGIVVDELVSAGIDESRVWSVAQGRNLSGAIKTVEVGLNNGKIVHCNQPLMNWAIGNCKTEASGNAIIITKAKSGAGKIDPVMALLDCVVLMQKHPAAARKGSIYSTMSDDLAEKLGISPKEKKKLTPEEEALEERRRLLEKRRNKEYLGQFESMELFQ